MATTDSGVIIGLGTALAGVVAGWFSSRATVKSAAVGNEGIYAQQLPELIDKINAISDERNELSEQLAALRSENELTLRENKALRTQVTRLNKRLDKLSREIGGE